MKNSAHELAVDCIYTALIQLMETKDYSEITITDITKKAGVSRMAYYRNYTDKDEILLGKLKDDLKAVEEMLNSRTKLTEKKLLEELVTAMLNDPLMERIVKADLVGKAFPLFKQSVVNLYTQNVECDLSDEYTRISIYKKLGCVMGYLMYLADNQANMNMDVFIEHLTSFADE